MINWAFAVVFVLTGLTRASLEHQWVWVAEDLSLLVAIVLGPRFQRPHNWRSNG